MRLLVISTKATAIGLAILGLLVNLALAIAIGLVILGFVAPVAAALLGAFPDGPY